MLNVYVINLLNSFMYNYNSGIHKTPGNHNIKIIYSVNIVSKVYKVPISIKIFFSLIGLFGKKNIIQMLRNG